MRTLRPLLGALVILVLVAACGDAEVPSGAPTATAIPEPTPVSQTYALGTKVWYAGLVVTFDRVTSLLDDRGGTVDLLVAVANPSADDAELAAAFTLVVGETRVLPVRESHVPSIPAKGSVATILTFEVQAIASVEAAAFELGGAPDHVARVPVTPAGGKTVAFEPVPLAITGSVQASSLKVVLKSGLLRWDLPDWAQELTATLQVLTLTYDATYTGGFAGGLAFTGDNIALKLPDGTVVTARKDGHSQSVELIGAHKTKKALQSRFEIPAGTTGTFLLVVRLSGVEKTIKFDIAG